MGTSKLAELKARRSIFGKTDPNVINNYCPPLSVRNDCSVGQFKFGGEDFIGSKLSVAILKVEPVYGKLGKSTGSWLRLWMIGAPGEDKLPRNVVCVMYVKTESMRALSETQIKVMDKEDPGLGIYEVGFSKRSGEAGNYFALEFNWRERVEEEADQLESILDFLDTNPALIDVNAPDTLVDVDTYAPESLAQAKVVVAGILEGSTT